MSFREIDCKRDQFRKYIETKGVIDSLTKVLTKLLETPEKPEHPMDFIRSNLGATQAEQRRIESLEQEVSDYKKEVSDLKTQLDAVKAKLSDFENVSDEKAEGKATSEPKADEPVQPTEAKVAESNQTNGGGAEADAIKDKNVSESEKAATPSPSETTVDSAKASVDSENAEVAKSNSIAEKSDDEKTATATAAEEDKTKPSENAAVADDSSKDK